jgi:hypothetical protein
MAKTNWTALDEQMAMQGAAMKGMRDMVSRADGDRSYRSQKRIPQSAVATLATKERFGKKF